MLPLFLPRAEFLPCKTFVKIPPQDEEYIVGLTTASSTRSSSSSLSMLACKNECSDHKNIYIYENNTAILEHSHRSAECKGNLESFEIIGRADNDFFLRIKESLLIKKFNPPLNQRGTSIPLYLFDRC